MLILDEYVVMPNHLHGIILLSEDSATEQAAPKRKTLGSLVGAFKTVSAKRINLLNNTSGRRVWQRDFHEHVLRSEFHLSRAREYIVNNPLKWDLDSENPVRGG